MTPRQLFWVVLCLTLGCGEEAPGIPEDCTRTEPVQLVPGLHDLMQVQRTRDTTFFNLIGTDRSKATYMGPACGADPILLVDGARMLPTRIALDPRDDDPTLLCDQDTDRNFRVDLTGKRAPELLFPDFYCQGRPTKYGALFSGGWGYLRLFPDFPDESTAIDLRDQGINGVLVLDEWIVYTDPSDLYAYRFSTGEITHIPGTILGMEGRGDHILWYDFEEIATATLVDLRSNTSIALGTFDREAATHAENDIGGFAHWTWDFDPSGKYIYHILPDVPPEAFDLTGQPVALPAPGEILALADSGVLSVTGEDGQVHFTRPHDKEPIALDAHLDVDRSFSTREIFADHFEKIIDGELVRVDFDGSPARTLATDIDRDHLRLTDHILVTLHDDGTLERIDIATGERARLASHVTRWQPAGHDLYFLTIDSPKSDDDGLWYLSAAALGVEPPEPPEP